MNDLNDLRLFAHVVQEGGFSAAERTTGIPKSRLSRRVAALEKELGVRLIQRSAHRFHVTEVGESVYRHARMIVDEAQAVAAAVGEVQADPSGLIRISAPVLIGELLAGWLAEFIDRYPKVTVSLDLSNQFVHLLAQRFDLAIRFATLPLASADVVARAIGHSQMVLVASPALLAAHGGEPTDIADLARYPALVQGTIEAMRPWAFESAAGEPLLHHPRPRLVTDNIAALREAAIRGAGVVQLPLEACHEALRAGALVRVMEAPSFQRIGAVRAVSDAARHAFVGAHADRVPRRRKAFERFRHAVQAGSCQRGNGAESG